MLFTLIITVFEDINIVWLTGTYRQNYTTGYVSSLVLDLFMYSKRPAIIYQQDSSRWSSYFTAYLLRISNATSRIL